MNDLSVFIYAVFFFAVAGATFAFMWKMTTVSIESINKPVERTNLHPEMRDIESGEELLVFRANTEDEDDEENRIFIKK
tara:strand:+ start:171 stop:407 length:237 start_codon:yes stop_codon:yes gene_type:complete